jgi:hypothetical protein
MNQRKLWHRWVLEALASSKGSLGKNWSFSLSVEKVPVNLMLQSLFKNGAEIGLLQ